MSIDKKEEERKRSIVPTCDTQPLNLPFFPFCPKCSRQENLEIALKVAIIQTNYLTAETLFLFSLTHLFLGCVFS